jgi:hypothetical protein
MHMSQGSPPTATVPFVQYSVAHCDSHAPLVPQSHAAISLTRIPMPAVCASWQQALHPLPVDIAAHLWSICPAFPPLLPEVLPPTEPLELPEVPPLVLPAPLPLLPPVLLPLELPVLLPLELPAVLPDPLPVLVTGELPPLIVPEEQPLA